MSILLRRGILAAISQELDATLELNQTYSARNFQSSPVVLSGLDGNNNDYEIIILLGTGSANTDFEILCNADATANYRTYRMKGSVSTANSSSVDSDSEMDFNEMVRTGGPSLGMMKITGSTGDERYQHGQNSGGQDKVLKTSHYWKNTASNLTSLTFQFAASATADAHIIVWSTPKSGNQGNWEEVATYSATGVNYSSSPTLIFSSLAGNTDKEYRIKLEYTSATNSTLGLRINSDSGSNYKRQNLRNKNSALATSNATTTSSRFSEENTAVTGVRNVDIVIDAETGAKRLIKTSFACSTNNGVDQQESTCWYSDTSTEVTGFTLASDTSGNADVTATLYKRKSATGTGDTLPLVNVDSEDFSSDDFSAGTTHSISGNSINLLKIEGVLSNASGDIEIRMQINSDTAANYSEQLLKGDTSTKTSASATRSYIVLAKLQNANQAKFETYFYTKSGSNRPALTQCSYDENAVEFLGQSWDNSGDAITTAKIYASSSNAITGNIKVSKLTG